MTTVSSPNASSQEPVVRSTVDLEHPWLGLEPYSEAHKQYFFGRDDELFEVTERIKHKRLTVLFGQSGLGKTSLIRAGVIPKLRESGFVPVSIRLRFESEATSLEAQVVDAILQQCHLPIPDDLENVSLWELLHHPRYGVVDSLYAETFQPVLIFDQFEEIWTLGQSKCPQASQEFMENFSAIVEGRPPKSIAARMEEDDSFADEFIVGQSPVKFLLTIREDYLHWIERWRSRMPSVMENRFEILALRGPQAFTAVYGPACLRHEANPELSPIVDEATARAIVSFVAGKNETCPLEEIDNVPPLLSLVCEQLNRDRLEKGQSNIGVTSPKDTAPYVLNAFYESCFEDLPDAVREFVEQELISESGFRESVSMDRACGKLASQGVKAPQDILQSLVTKRVLTIDQRGDTSKLELTHDVLTPIARQSRLRRAEIRSNQLRKERWIKQALTAALAVFVLATIGLSIFSSLKAIEASDERDNATEQMRIAQEQSREAIRQKAFAEQQRQLAEQQRSDAQQSREVAESEAENARKAELEAQTQREIADQKRQEALAEHQKFVTAEQQFRRTSSLSHYAYGLNSLAQDVMAGQFGAKSFSGGVSQWKEAMATWAKSIAIDSQNLATANAVFATLQVSGANRIQLPRLVGKVDRSTPIASGMTADMLWFAYPSEIVYLNLESGEKKTISSDGEITFCHNLSRQGSIGFSSNDGTLKIVDLAEFSILFEHEFESAARDVDLDPDADRLALFFEDQSYIAFAGEGREPQILATEGLSKPMPNRWLKTGWVTSQFELDQWSIVFQGQDEPLELRGALYQFEAFGDRVLTVRQGPGGESTETSESGSTRVGHYIELWDAGDRSRVAVVEAESRIINLEMSSEHSHFATWGSASGGGCSPVPMGASTDLAAAKNVVVYSTIGLTTGTRTLAHPVHVEWVSFSPDGELLWTLDAESTLRAWDPKTGKQASEIRHTPGSIQPLGATLDECVVLGEDGFLRQYDALAVDESPSYSSNFYALVKDDDITSVSTLKFDEQSHEVSARTYSGRILTFDRDLENVQLKEAPLDEAVMASAESSDGRITVSSRYEEEQVFLDVRNVDSDELLASLETTQHALSVCLSDDGKLLAYTIAPKVAVIHDLSVGENLAESFVAPNSINKLVLDSARNLLIAQTGSGGGCGGEPEQIALQGWDIRTATLKWSPLTGITGFKRSRDGMSLLAKSEDGSLRWINIENGQPNSAALYPKSYISHFVEGEDDEVYLLSGHELTREKLPRFDRPQVVEEPTPEVLVWIELATGVRYEEGLFSPIGDDERLKLLELGPELPAPWRELHQQLFGDERADEQPQEITLVLRQN